MILLERNSDLNEGEYVHSRGEEDLRVTVDASNSSHDRLVFEYKVLKEPWEGSETVTNVILIGVAS